jgi:hypothetical protein
MEYNTQRPVMRYSEYGRIIKSYVDYLLSIEDREKRTKAARSVIEMMTMANPQFKSIEEYKHKLWDHLYAMSNFKLDVDSPYPKPDATDAVFIKPNRLPYPKSKIKKKTFGKHIERFIEKSKHETDPDKIRGFSETAAYYLKLAYLNWNNESVTDEEIKTDLANMSDGYLSFGEEFKLDNVKAGGAYQQNYGREKKPKGKSNFKQRNFKGNGGGNGNGNGGGKRFFKKR